MKNCYLLSGTLHNVDILSKVFCQARQFIVVYSLYTKGKIIAKEESSVGSVSWKVYCAFMKAGGGT